MLLIKITKSGKIVKCEKENIDFLEKNKNIDKLNIWKNEDIDFVLYGCKNGDAGKENKFDLPPPVDCELYFDDLYFVKYKNNNIVDLEVNNFNEFYNNCFGGFEDIEKSDNEKDEEEFSEHTSDLEFINDNSDISLCSDTMNLDLSSISTFSEEIEIKETTEKDSTDKDINIELDLEVSSLDITISCSSIENDEEVNTESDKN